MKIGFSAEARLDIHVIFEYGIANFGFEAADAYAEALIARIERAADYPLAGEGYDSRGRLYRRIGYRRHFVYYRVERDTLLVVRVLHKQMLQDRHLP